MCFAFFKAFLCCLAVAVWFCGFGAACRESKEDTAANALFIVGTFALWSMLPCLIGVLVTL